MEFSKGQLDKLGERLKADLRAVEDLEALDAYRRSFRSAYDQVVDALRAGLGLEPSGRAAKTTDAIIAKLRRAQFKLSRLQDIAGCRVVVADVRAQDEVVRQLSSMFSPVRVVDRRQKPSHGYRAVHAIVRIEGKDVEVQVRTQLQHDWAQFSEKLSDMIGPEIKYGGGSKEIRAQLLLWSGLGEAQERAETREAILAESERKKFERSREILREQMGYVVDGVARGKIR